MIGFKYLSAGAEELLQKVIEIEPQVYPTELNQKYFAQELNERGYCKFSQ